MNSITGHSIPANHPSLSGHFPGHPVVPGVVLLEEIVIAVREWQPAARILGFQAVKFLRPVTPDCRFSIALEMLDKGKIGFSCSAGQRLLSSGTVLLKVSQETA